MKNLTTLFLTLLILALAENAIAQPTLTGKIYYHNYSGYENWDANIYSLDLATGTRTWLSQNWPIDHEMNVHVSPDGTKLVFMGDDRGGPRNWDIYIWTIGSSSNPQNLTNGGGREEDPKFSPDGTKIVFKKENDVWQMDLNGNIINNVTNTPSVEESMPFYTADGQSILFAPGVGAGSDIYAVNTNGTNYRAEVAVANVQEYFPITRDNSSFFYTTWENAGSRFDQIYLKYYSNSSGTRLPFNTSNANYSDAYPVGSNYLLLSSSKAGGKGGYDLYIAEVNGTGIWSLDTYNANTNSSWEELGAVYYPGGSTTNNPPTVSITSPSNGASFNAPATITVSANASDDGGIARVEFFNGATKLGEDTSAPYSMSWSNVSSGSYTITARATDNTGLTTTSSGISVTVNGTSSQTPYGGTARTLPGKIEAENYDNGGQSIAYSDNTSGNAGGVYRSDGVDIEGTTDTGGGYNVGWIETGEWLEYTVSISSGTFRIDSRVASTTGGGRFHIELDGVNITGPVNVGNTGGWQVWQTVSANTSSVSAGQKVLRFVVEAGNFNINSLTFVSTGGAAQTPYGGTVRAIPGKIEAEHYDLGGEGVAYHDLTTGNSGNVFRADGVDLEATADAGGGYDVGGINTGEWLEYTVSVAQGTYRIEARVATASSGGRLHFEFDGVNVGSISVPVTGGWQAWQTVSVNTTSISSGQKVLRVYFDAGNFNLSYLNFVRLTTARLGAPEIKEAIHSFTARNYPNPFQANTTLDLHLIHSGKISIVLCDVHGIELNEVFNGYLEKGSHQISLPGDKLKSGIYTIVIKQNGNKIIRRVIRE